MAVMVAGGCGGEGMKSLVDEGGGRVGEFVGRSLGFGNGRVSGLMVRGVIEEMWMWNIVCL